MKDINQIKKSIFIKKIILLVCLFLLVVSGGYVVFSYSLKDQNVNVVLSEDKKEAQEEEEKVNYEGLIDNMANTISYIDMYLTDVRINIKREEPVKVPKATVATANNKEDPMKVVKVDKGVAKKEEAKKAVEKYETNETSFGIDVSSYQGVIDWKKVKESGVTFAMIRVGFRGYGTGDIFEDRYFRRNVQGAAANNINVGIYFFSAAKDSEEALEEAVWVADTIKNYDITYPVAIDIEIFNEYRLEGVSNAQMTENALVFCRYIQSKGYTPMIYSYLKALNNIFETPKFGNFRVWLAQYNDEATYKGKYHMWQYTSDGSVPGITGRVDMNVAYFSVTNDVTKKSEATGTDGSAKLEEVFFDEASENITINKTVTLRTSPYTNAPNRVGEMEKGTQVKLIGSNDNFIKILYEGSEFYIADTNCFDLSEVTFTSFTENGKTKKDVLLYLKPYEITHGSRMLEAGTNIIVLGNNTSYTQIKIDDKVYYVKDLDFYDVISEDNGSNQNNANNDEENINNSDNLGEENGNEDEIIIENEE